MQLLVSGFAEGTGATLMYKMALFVTVHTVLSGAC